MRVAFRRQAPGYSADDFYKRFLQKLFLQGQAFLDLTQEILHGQTLISITGITRALRTLRGQALQVLFIKKTARTVVSRSVLSLAGLIGGSLLMAANVSAADCPHGDLDARYCDADGDLVADLPEYTG